jgi:hypothetical protein
MKNILLCGTLGERSSEVQVFFCACNALLNLRLSDLADGLEIHTYRCYELMKRSIKLLTLLSLLLIAFVRAGAQTAAPAITSLSAASLARSGRLIIQGANFGVSQNAGQVRIGGLSAPVTRWTETMIVAYVPEATPLGTNMISVTTSFGSSNQQALDVTMRPAADGHVKWRFQADAPYTKSRAVVGSDGTVYVNDIYSHLYALAPDGALKWIFNGAGSEGISLGPDDTVYVGSTGFITAVNPNGTLKWRFTQNPIALFLLGPAVGPDGNIYAIATQGIGIFSLTPAGQLRWTAPETYTRPIINYQEPVFGPGGKGLQMYFAANNHFRAISSSGSPVFTLSSIAREPQPVVGPDGNVYEGRGKFSPSGATLFSFPLDGLDGPPINTMSAPETSTAGMYYMVKNGYTIFSYTLNGSENWRFTEGGILFDPIASPQSDLLVLGGRVNYGEPGFFLAVGSDGLLKWRADLPFESGNWIIPNTRARFAPDGQTAYIGAGIPGQVGDEYCYLYALQTAASPAPSSLTSLTINPVSVRGGSSSLATVTLSGPAPVGGAVLMLSSDNPATASAPFSITIPAGAVSATFQVTTSAVILTTPVTISASYLGVTKAAQLTVAPAGPALSAIIMSTIITGGDTTSAMVLLDGAAPVGGAVISVSSSNPVVVSVPPNFTIPEGMTSGAFSVVTSPVNTTTPVSLTLTYNGSIAGKNLTIAPIASAAVSSITLSQPSVIAGGSSQALIMLSGAAPSGGAMVSLSNSNPSAAGAPASVTIPAGASSVTFAVTTAPGTKVQATATITASYGGQSASATLTISTGQTGDMVGIQQADYISSKRLLRIQASSTNASATLSVYVTSTGQLIGSLKNNGGGKYSADLNWPANPLNITVRSSAGGSATRAIALK